MGGREDLARLGDTRVSLPAGFEIAREVRAAALGWPVHARLGEPYSDDRGQTVYGREDLCCNACGQSIAVLRLNRQPYQYTGDEVEGQLLSHLMIVHHWTREATGDPAPDRPERDRVGLPASGASSP